MRLREGARRTAGVGLLSSALVLSAGAAARADFWVYGTGSATYHDRELAHAAAYREAIANADRSCGTMATSDQVEIQTSYGHPSSDPSQWRAVVRVREMCIELVHPVP